VREICDAAAKPNFVTGSFGKNEISSVGNKYTKPLKPTVAFFFPLMDAAGIDDVL
jgi:hypothetical protein